LALVVRAWRRRSARRDAARAPAFQDPEERRQQGVCVAAAKEVVDTLAPFMVADLDVLTVEDSELEGLQLRDNPPATRLHPRGPYAGLGQRLVLRALSKNVARLAAEST
jgi:hypothetical protein